MYTDVLPPVSYLKTYLAFFTSNLKRMRILLIWSVAVLLHGFTYAQNPHSFNLQKAEKPSLFDNLPARFLCDESELIKLINAGLGVEINSQLSSQFSIQGEIIDKDQPNGTTLTANIRLKNYKNALFSCSVRFLADNTFMFRGRILHPRYGDVLMLSKERDGNYYFTKKPQKLIMPD